MAIATIKNSPPALSIRGQYSKPNGVGRMWCGWSDLGHDDDLAGIYQKNKSKKGIHCIKQVFYCGSNPRFSSQQAWRAFFANVVDIYHALSADDLAYFNTYKYPARMTGFNRFTHYYLKRAPSDCGNMVCGFSPLGNLKLGGRTF